MLLAIAGAGLAGCMGRLQPGPGADDARDIARAQAYLDGLRCFTASFTQTGSDGPAEGLVWLDRPGRLRLDYVRPRPKLLLVNHGRLLLLDRLTSGTTLLPVSRTPLDILLADHIALSGPITVTNVQRQPGAFQISLVKAATPGQGTLTLQFSDAPIALLGVVIQDSKGRTNTLTLSNLKPVATIPDTEFTRQT
jgi:outer membrane lipoprotein-sorting protein